MPGQNLPVPGDGAYLIKVRENIAWGHAHTFSAVTSTQHTGAAAGTASLQCAFCCSLPSSASNTQVGWTFCLHEGCSESWKETEGLQLLLTLVRREGIQNPLWGPALPLYLIKKGCLCHYEINRSQTTLTSVPVYSLCCWCGLALKK